MRTLRASEIGAFLYCQRAWWYQRRGEVPANQAELAAGRQLHERHGRATLGVGCLRAAALALLLAALAVVAVYFTGQSL